MLINVYCLCITLLIMQKEHGCVINKAINVNYLCKVINKFCLTHTLYTFFLD